MDILAGRADDSFIQNAAKVGDYIAQNTIIDELYHCHNNHQRYFMLTIWTNVAVRTGNPRSDLNSILRYAQYFLSDHEKLEAQVAAANYCPQKYCLYQNHSSIRRHCCL